jgi:hypothetical protein
VSALQADSLAPLRLHAQLQSVEAVEPIDALLVDRPALSSQHHVHAQIAEPRSIHRNVANSQAQGALIARLALGVPDRSAQQCQTA